jgi:4-amino-4-deoxy-L-arabinose transferase-like glycosyltransferase
MGSLRAAPRWVAPAVLAVPYLVAIAALRGLTVRLPIFHGGDELNYHYPTILRFGRELPFPDLSAYHAAQTPLFHLLLAYVGKVIGYELWRLRLVEALISYLAALAVFVLLHRRLGLDRATALVLSLLFALSPYMYGGSFRLLTDNLATLFVVVALERFERFRESERLGPFVVGCACVGAAMLTRQSTAFMIGVAGLYAVFAGLPARAPGRGWHALGERAGLLAFVAVAVVPVGVLFLTWHGLVPPGGDPSSCGLCPTRGAGQSAAGHLVVPSAELALATIGIYGAVLFAPALVRWLRSGRDLLADARGPLAGATAGALLLLIEPARPGRHDAGIIWRAAGHFPSLRGSSLLFWALVPLGGAVLWARARLAPRRFLVLAFSACFLASTLVIRYPWQKYVDPFALLIVIVTVRPRELITGRDFAGAGVLGVAFVAYALSFV